MLDSLSVIQFDSLSVRKDSLLVSDSLKKKLFQDSLLAAKRDSIIRDSLKLDSIRKAFPDISVNFSKRNRKRIPLPPDIKLTFVDSADVIADYYLAIEDYFRTTYKSLSKQSIFQVEVSKRKYQTDAFVRSMPLLQAEFEEKKEQKFISNIQLKNFREKQIEYFDKFIDVVVNIKTKYITATELDPTMFTIRLMSNSISLDVEKKQLLPVFTHLTQYIPWYERRIILSFPRYKSGIDLWNNRKITLFINLKNKMGISSNGIQSDFRFELNPENKIPIDSLNVIK